MQIAVIGSNGQVGSEIVLAAKAVGIPTIALRHKDCEVTDAASIERSLAVLRERDVVVNTAALHRTDECEDAVDRALSVNALGAYRVAAAARERGATVVYISSDFVFDGAKRTPYVESDQVNPINMYGLTKATGEALVRVANPAHYVVRISAVFGAAGSSGKGGNFVESMVAKVQSGTTPEVVDDIVMAPTSARDAAKLLIRLLQKQAPFGTYHLANAGFCSWREFADAILELCGTNIRAKPLAARTLSGKAKRPAYSVLASEKLESFDLRARPWEDALREYLGDKGYIPR